MEENKTQSSTVWYKNWKVLAVIIIIACSVIGNLTHPNSSGGGGSGSSSGVSHTCINCGKTYSGYGYATVGGEEYALDKDQGNQYCSSSCAKASRTGKFKNM